MPLALGAADGFAMFVRAITRPEPGPYAIDAAASRAVPPNSWGARVAARRLRSSSAAGEPRSTSRSATGEGRFIDNDYDYTQGYWWADYQIQVGQLLREGPRALRT